MKSDKENSYNKVVALLIILLSVLMHQSMRTPIGNLSSADLVLIVLIIYVFLNKKFLINKWHLLIIQLFFLHIILTSAFISPVRFNVQVSSMSFIAEIIKLILLFLYFFTGSFIAKGEYIDKMLKVYSNTAVIIGLIGIILSFISFSALNSFMFKYGTRLNGFINDPNYFAILQVSALSYHFKKNMGKTKIPSVIIIILSIVLSGSKTGILVFAVYLFIFYIEKFMSNVQNISAKKMLRNIMLIMLFTYGINLIVNNLYEIMFWLTSHFPVTSRLTTLFTDTESAISGGGSGRDIAWKTGIKIIEMAPILGVGVDNYLNIASKNFGTAVLAHNTYIQLAAEWGLPITLLFFGSILLLVVKIGINRYTSITLGILKDILIVFLIGSLGISLNNARFFWIILGGTIGVFIKERIYVK